MNRLVMLQKLNETETWDIVIIGGGATGLGSAVDAASRGYKTLLVEQHDFAKGTSSRSTKLVHGGVRYLAQGNIKLVREALRERGFLLKNAPQVTSVQPFIVPVYSWWEKCYYAIGLIIYDILSGSLSLGKTKILSKKQILERMPAINPTGLSGGILYYDGQFDDSRLCTDLAITASIQGGVLLNYCKAEGFIKNGTKIIGVNLFDSIHKIQYEVKAKAVINATGVFTDSVMQLEDAEKHNLVSPSQGIHLVVDASFFPGKDAMMIPKTADGRVLFAVPWKGKIVLGTTDTPIELVSTEPKALEAEIQFILTHFNQYTTGTLTPSDVLSVFVGLRPLVKSKSTKSTALISRDHTLFISAGGLVTITGGKWTTYRKMAQDAVDNAVFVAKLSPKPCISQTLGLGNTRNRLGAMERIIKLHPDLGDLLHPDFPYTKAEVIFAARNEMAQTIEDVLARRTRILFLNAKAAIQLAPKVAEMMALELNKDANWQIDQIKVFNELANEYLVAYI